MKHTKHMKLAMVALLMFTLPGYANADDGSSKTPVQISLYDGFTDSLLGSVDDVAFGTRSACHITGQVCVIVQATMNIQRIDNSPNMASHSTMCHGQSNNPHWGGSLKCDTTLGKFTCPFEPNQGCGDDFLDIANGGCKYSKLEATGTATLTDSLFSVSATAIDSICEKR